MTPYERGYAAGLKAAEKVLHSRSMLAWARYKGFSTTRGDTRDEAAADALEAAMYEILSLPIEGEATNAGPNATQPVAESQAPAPSEPGDRGVAPTLADSRPARPGPSQECVVVPREPKKGLLCGDVAISTDPRYAGWVFVRHVDGINWTTGAKLTPETWAMLAAADKQKARKR